MKQNIQDQRVPTDWSPVKRAVFLPLTLVVGLGLVAVVAAATAKKSAATKPAPPDKILYVGDSLSVGTFGELLTDYFVRTYSRSNVAFYASCGSSPENWLSDEPVYETKCGYRESVPGKPLIFGDPMRHRTPKIEGLLRQFQPTIVFVQQGTNWMDRPLSDDKIANILDRFVSVIHRNAQCKIVWIAPPDSSRFRRVQGRIYTLIQQRHRRGDIVIDSRRLTRTYVVGKTGGDGIHYRSEAAAQWAGKIIGIFDEILPKPGRRTADLGRVIELLDNQDDLTAD
jgi:hypothetical protein